MNLDSFNRSRDATNDSRAERSSTDHIQLSMIPPISSTTTDNIDNPGNNLINNRYLEESTFVRTDSLKSSSLLKLTDIITQNILIHPFIALRRTCQVNRKCSPFICVQPFSLMSFMYHQQRKQGIAALYKGLSSELLVKGMTLGTVTALANYAEWPTEVHSKRYLEDSLKVAILRGLSVAITTPFLCSSVIETVQSVIVVKDRPSFIDCLKEGFFRLLQIRSSPSTRIIPIWLLIAPTVFYHVAHSTVKHISENFVDLFKSSMSSARSRSSTSRSRRIRHNNNNDTLMESGIDSTMWQRSKRHQRHQNFDLTNATTTFDQNQLDTSEVDNVNNIELDSNKISTSIIASLIADISLLPVETILNRLYIQGTRTIIDNCDETTVVLPVLTNYEGFSDCYQSILRFEGNLGLFKGLGAIVLQYSLHFLLFRSLYFLLREVKLNFLGDSGNQRPPVSNRRLDPVSRNGREYMRQYNHLPNTLHSTPNTISERVNNHHRQFVDDDDDDDNYRLPRGPLSPYDRMK